MIIFLSTIQTLNLLPQFPKPISVGEEIRASSNYHWEGKRRKGKDRPHGIFQYSLGGCGVLRDGMLEYPVPAGVGFLCASHDRRIAYYYPPDGVKPWHFIYIAFTGKTAIWMMRNLIHKYGYLYNLPSSHVIIKRLRSFKIYHRTQYILSDSEGADIIAELLFALAASKEQIQKVQPDHILVRRALEEIRNQPLSGLDIQALAMRLHVSREHLTRLFKTQTGIPPHHFILNEKLIVACQLLKNNLLSVKEIADRLGFSQSSHFIRVFQRMFRMTPTKFRESGIPSVIIPEPSRQKRRN